MSGTKPDEDVDQGDNNPLAMSDEDFLKLGSPQSDAGGADSEDKNPSTEEKQSAEGADASSGSDTAEGGEGQEADPKASGEGEPEGEPAAASGKETEKEPAADGKTAEGGTDSKDKSKPADAKPEGKAEAADAAGSDKPATADAMAEFYRRVVETPLRANGKTIKINSPEEAISLMQMGANYTRKLQELAPVRKIVAMLDKNQLLDEGKLSFLIDIANKNPDAIKKLVKDAGIDPMEIDTSAETNYTPGNHRVSDAEVRFQTALTTLKSSESGVETLKVINAQWDDASKDLLWENPEVLEVIHEQRENGVYATITAEVERQKTVGLIPPEVPFLQAYKFVGDQLSARAKPKAEAKSAPTLNPEPKPVAARTTLPKKGPVSNSDRAKAAAGTRGTPGSARVLVNPLAMSDDEFLKQMSNRL